MKAIQITVDEKLLSEVDGTEEARRDGRSAVFRRAAAEYLARSRRQAIAAAYTRAYGDSDPERELGGWSEEGVWPER
jgi:metal-responsive CopG/Arc/MetJ family transcriptional regulator